MDEKKFAAGKENEVENIPSGKEDPSTMDVKKTPAENDVKKVPAAKEDPSPTVDAKNFPEEDVVKKVPETVSSVASSPKKFNRFELKKWNATVQWNFDTDEKICRICRFGIMDNCVECQAKGDPVGEGKDCDAVWGVCGHIFHLHCMDRWLKSRLSCPIDSSAWESQKYGRWKE